MTTFKLTLAYEGTDFVGWQRQASGRSVQAVVEDALARIEGAAVSIAAAGRTDAGVHALGQVASATLTHDIDASSLRRALNATLPFDVRVLAVEPAADGFHARFSARSKTYRYRIVTGEIISPFVRRFAWHVPGPLDLDEMQRSAGHLVGRHDFAAFQSSGGNVITTIRTVRSSRLIGVAMDDGQEITYEVTGDGFLRHMVRAIVGTLIEVGAGRLTSDALEAIIASRERQNAGPTAPPHGLFLVQVTYDSDQSPHTHVDDELA